MSKSVKWRSLAGAAVMALAAGTAHADMVVIATTAPGVQLGQILAEGAKLDLPDGAEITVLSVDGATHTIKGPGGTVDKAPTNGADSGVLDALGKLISQKENLAGVGAVRSASKCAGMTDVLAMLKKGCEREAAIRLKEMSATLSPSLFIGAQKPGSRPAFKLGEQIDITVQSNFDAYVYCFHEGSDGTTTRLVPLTGAPPKLTANKPASLAGELGQFGALVASTPSGIDQLECFASEQNLALVEPDIYGGTPSLGKRALEGKVRQSFAELAPERSAAGRIELEILR